MKHFILSGILFLALFGILSTSCTKTSSNNTPAPAATSLQIYIMDVSGTYSVPCPNPQIQLFKSNGDRMAKTNPASAIVIGDSKGYVTFNNLEAIDYYFNAYNSDMSKSNAALGNHTGVLTSGILNKIGSGVK